MSGFIQEFQFYMSYPFVRYALIVGVLISLCSSLLGVTLVLKRFSFIGDGLSHVAFGALAIATVLKIANVNIFIMPVTIVCAILLLRTGTNTKLKGDAAIAMLSVGSMAVGYLILNVFSVSSNVSGDVCSTLFGSTSILTLTGSEVIMCVIASLVVVAFFIIFSVNGKTKFIFFALVTLWIACMMYFITELKSYLIQLFFFITLWLFLFSRPMIDYIQTKSFATYNANTYQFSFFVREMLCRAMSYLGKRCQPAHRFGFLA